MKYTQAREIVESALDVLLNEALVGKKVKKPTSKAAKKVKHTSYSNERPSTPEDTAAWYRSQPQRSDGLREPVPYVGWKPGGGMPIHEMATPKVEKKLKDYKNQSEYMRKKRSQQRYPLGHQKKGVSMKSDAVKKLRDLIDHHGTQATLHGQNYNSTMDANSRAQSYAHHEAKSDAIKAHKALTGKDYFGKKPKKGAKAPAAQSIKTDASHYERRTGPGGFRW
jgi:hypothetical protein